MTQLTQYRGDTIAHAIATSDQYDLTAFASVIFTAKKNTYDPDSAAIIQKVLGAGLAATSAQLATVDIVPQDTATLENDALNLVWDVQGQQSGGQVRTVACGTLKIDRDVTIETTSSIPIYTTNPPAPGSGSGANAFTHVQALASDEWIINHNFGFWPVVLTFNAIGQEMQAQITNPTLNQTRVLFNQPTTGTARLI